MTAIAIEVAIIEATKIPGRLAEEFCPKGENAELELCKGLALAGEAGKKIDAGEVAGVVNTVASRRRLGVFLPNRK